jgi:membrane-bound lytic murein transglycosylase D
MNTRWKRFLKYTALAAAAAVALSGCAITLKDTAIKETLTLTKREQKIVSSISKSTPEFPIVANEEVNDEIEKLMRSPYSINKWLSRSKRFEALMKGIFIEQGIPEDMFYVAILESGFDPHVISSREAGGPWQFIPSTARRMGMKMDEWVDERRDYEKSTRYAARYFSYFYRSFDDWYLALAGYNCGGAPVRRAIKKCGNVTIWEMGKKGMLASQAGGYVPRIIALVAIMNEPEKYGFTAPTDVRPMTYDKIYVPGGLPLSFFAGVIGVKEKTLRKLNPELLRGITPPGAVDYELKIPPGKKLIYLKKFDEALEKYREAPNSAAAVSR